MIRYLIVAALMSLTFFARSQSASECARSLDQAELAFEQGRLSDIVSIFTNEKSGFYQCLNNNVFNIEEEIRAYKLLTKTYLFQDNEEMAEEMFIKLLKVDKEHQLAAEDPAELYLLKDKFHTEPIFRVALRGGVNKSLPSVIQSFNTFQSGEKRYNGAGQETGPGIGFWGEMLVERHFKKGIELAMGAQYRLATYEIEGEVIANDLVYVAKNVSNMLRIPIIGRYSLSYSKKDDDGNRVSFLPYVFGGISADFMLKAKYSDTRRTGGTAFTLPDGSDDLSESNQVAASNVSLIAGVGMRFRVGRSKVDFLSFELRYDNSLLNYINPENRWINEDLAFGIGHVEDDLTLDVVSFSIGYTKSLYLPRKRKEYR